jgi:hypothetical protein
MQIFGDPIQVPYTYTWYTTTRDDQQKGKVQVQLYHKVQVVARYHAYCCVYASCNDNKAAFKMIVEDGIIWTWKILLLHIYTCTLRSLVVELASQSTYGQICGCLIFPPVRLLLLVLHANLLPFVSTVRTLA